MKEFLELVILSKEKSKFDFAQCTNTHQLTVVKNAIIGKNSSLIKTFNNLPKVAKRQASKELQLCKQEIELLYQTYLKKIATKMAILKINSNFQQLHQENKANNYLTKQGIDLNFGLGKKHQLTKTIEDLHHFCQKMNWSFVSSKELVPFAQNFELLNIVTDHPAMGPKDSFIVNVENEEKSKWVLRTHCTSMTAKELKKYGKDNKPRSVYTIGNVYRNDTDDSRHLKQFSQLDVCLIGKEFSLAQLKWILSEFCQFLFGKKQAVRFRNTFFPFTEPSLEVDISCSLCQQKGCSVCNNTGWIELLGAGIINQAVLTKCQVKEKIQALAFGVGIERVVMIREQINDIRTLYTINSQRK